MLEFLLLIGPALIQRPRRALRPDRDKKDFGSTFDLL